MDCREVARSRVLVIYCVTLYMMFMSAKDLLAVVGVIVLFVVVSAAAQHYRNDITELVQVKGVLGVVSYVGITIIAVVVAPVSTMPLLPVAVALWGPVVAALLSIVGWTAGAVIAFMLARVYGRLLVGRFMDLGAMKRIEQVVPKEHVFVSVLFLRMGLPVDLLSYALGLFSTMSLQSYILATVIGVSPFAFVFAYAANWPIVYQVAVGVVAISIVVYGYARYK